VKEVIEQLVSLSIEAGGIRRPARPGRFSAESCNLLRLEFSKSRHWPVPIPANAAKKNPRRHCIACKSHRGQGTGKPLDQRRFSKACGNKVHVWWMWWLTSTVRQSMLSALSHSERLLNWTVAPVYLATMDHCILDVLSVRTISVLSVQNLAFSCRW